MKKDDNGQPFCKLRLVRFLIMMKVVWILVLASVFQVSAGTSEIYSQSVKLDLKLQGANLEEVIWKVKDQTEFEFFYLSEDVKDVKDISISVKNATIDRILDECLEKTNLEYQIVHKAVIIKKSEKEFSNLPWELNVEQKKKISGVVKNERGESIPGVAVLIKGSTTGTATDIDGQFSMEIPDNAQTLVFSFVGMRTKEVAIGDKLSFSIVLEEEAIGLDEVVAVGYGFKTKMNLTGAVATVSSKTLETVAPVANATNTLAGRLPGLIAKQGTGSPGRDAASLNIRGFGSALIIIDGVEGSISLLDPNEIESVSVLKDASAAIYGARAGNGVILVTTKRGKSGKVNIVLNSSYTQQRITNFPRMLNAGQFAEWDRENKINRGLDEGQQRFSAEDVQKYYEGTDPAYEGTDWYEKTVRPYSPQQQHNLSIRGGGDNVKFFGMFSALDQETFWKNNGGDYKRYNVRANIDAKISDNLSAELGFSNMTNIRNFPMREKGYDNKALWQDLQLSEPTYNSNFPDPTKLPYATIPVGGSILASSDIDKTGYNLKEGLLTQINFALKYDVPFLKGLSAKIFTNYYQFSGAIKEFVKPATFYEYNHNTQEYTVKGTWSPEAGVMERRERSRKITNQLSLNFDRTFGDHKISALVLYESIDEFEDYIQASRQHFITPAIEYLFGGTVEDQYANGSATEMGRMSYVSRVNYSFKDKYLLEATLRADASAKFAPENRWGYFPSVSAGWRISEERFIKDNVSWIETLKLRGGASKTGFDNVASFAYLSGYQLSGNYLFTSTSSMAGLISTGLANPILTWEEHSIYNVGVDFSIFKSKLYGEADVFYRKREGIPASRKTSLPSTFGATLPPENINSSNNRGFEFLLGTKGGNGDFSYDVSANVSWARAKWGHFEEPDYDSEDVDPDLKRLQKRSGQWTDRVFGYKSDGLYTSMEEIEALTFVQDKLDNTTLRPGDIKYIDTNGDKVLDWRDKVEIGKGDTPHWMFGFNTNLVYKNFELNALIQGAAGFSVSMKSRVNEVMFKEHWTEANNRADALFPRNGSIAQGTDDSDFNLISGDYVRLKSLNIGYNLPSNWLNVVNISNVKIYMAGSNLFTISKTMRYGIDPEGEGNDFANSYYPQQRTFTLGINLTL